MAHFYLVGAGPGRADLLTLAAFRALNQADVVLYDRLVSDEVLALIPDATEKIYVGKSEGEQDSVQAEIFSYFERLAQTDKIAVRLKGGDPFIFARGLDELLELNKLSTSVTIVPGISSALGIPALVGIPLTARGYSAEFAVVTGHDPDSVNWEKYAEIDTLVLLMSSKRISYIASELIRFGRSELESVAIIENGTLQNEIVKFAYLRELVTKEVTATSPAVIVVGKVTDIAKNAQVSDQTNQRVELFEVLANR